MDPTTSPPAAENSSDASLSTATRAITEYREGPQDDAALQLLRQAVREAVERGHTVDEIAVHAGASVNDLLELLAK